jgi:hypothetical protein
VLSRTSELKICLLSAEEDVGIREKVKGLTDFAAEASQ